MPELLTYQRLNTSTIPEAAFTPVWQPRRASSLGSDVRIKRQSRPYWKADLSGVTMNEKQKNDLLGMIYRNGGMTKPILVSVPPFCEIGTKTGFDNEDEDIVTPAPLCIGDGGDMLVQLRKRLLVTGFEQEFIYHDVKYPHYDYPLQESIGRTIAGPIPWNPLRDVMVFENGTPLPGVRFDVQKETGLVTVFDTILGANYTVTGGFYLLMLLPNEIPMTAKGGGLWEIKSGVSLVEPYGGI